MPTLTRTLELDFARPRTELLARIERALDAVNETHSLAFSHDGTEVEDGVEFTVWTDDPDGTTESSWVQMIDSPADEKLSLAVNAIDESQLQAVSSALASELQLLAADAPA